jgi:hypothetical protein
VIEGFDGRLRILRWHEARAAHVHAGALVELPGAEPIAA